MSESESRTAVLERALRDLLDLAEDMHGRTDCEGTCSCKRIIAETERTLEEKARD